MIVDLGDGTPGDVLDVELQAGVDGPMTTRVPAELLHQVRRAVAAAVRLIHERVSSHVPFSLS